MAAMTEVPRAGKTFYTRHGEAALVKKGADDSVEIFVKDKLTFRCFTDRQYPRRTHVMMATPSGHFGAGRNLPANYLEEANALVTSAQTAVSNPGFVQRSLLRWNR